MTSALDVAESQRHLLTTFTTGEKFSVFIGWVVTREAEQCSATYRTPVLWCICDQKNTLRRENSDS